MRLRDIGDARLELVPVDEAALGLTTAAGTAEQKRAPSLFARLVIAGLVLAVVGGALEWYRRTIDSPAPALTETAAVSVDRPLRALTFGPGLQSGATFSPDGRSIAYASDRSGNSDIWIQSLEGGQPHQLTNSPAAETQPAWSPDGTRIVFRSDHGTGGLYLIPAKGGPVRQLTSFGSHPVWSTGSEILFRTGYSMRQVGIYAVSADGGAPRELAQSFLRGETWHWIGLHPDGRISVIGTHEDRRVGFFTLSRDGSQVVVSTIPKDLPFDVNELVRFPLDFSGTRKAPRSTWRPRVNRCRTSGACAWTRAPWHGLPPSA